jgi:hypothetical protein
MGHRQKGKSKKRRRSWHRGRVQGVRWLRIDRMFKRIRDKEAA